MDKTISIGSKRDKPKKVIEVNVTKKHIFGFFIFLLILVFFIIKIFNSFFGSYESLEFRCNDGSIEKIEYKKQIYCGQHFTEVTRHLDEKQSLAVENLILYNETK